MKGVHREKMKEREMAREGLGTQDESMSVGTRPEDGPVSYYVREFTAVNGSEVARM